MSGGMEREEREQSRGERSGICKSAGFERTEGGMRRELFSPKWTGGERSEAEREREGNGMDDMKILNECEDG